MRPKLSGAAAVIVFGLFVASPWALLGCGNDASTASAATGSGSTTNSASSTSTTTAASKVTCTPQTAPTCADPNAGPSYSKAVANLIYGYCLQCHNPNGVANISGSTHAFTPPPGGYGAFGGNPNDANNMANDANGASASGNFRMAPGMGGNANQHDWDPRPEYDWSDYHNIRRHAQDMVNVLTQCVMPPSNATSIPDADRTTLLQWLVCGAQDN